MKIDQHCAFGCGLPTEGRSDLFYEVIGWEKKRGGGGTNALRLRKQTGAIAHSICIDKAAKGIHPNQQELWTGSAT